MRRSTYEPVIEMFLERSCSLVLELSKKRLGTWNIISKDAVLRNVPERSRNISRNGFM